MLFITPGLQAYLLNNTSGRWRTFYINALLQACLEAAAHALQ
jgi:hypothetical protein